MGIDIVLYDEKYALQETVAFSYIKFPLMEVNPKSGLSADFYLEATLIGRKTFIRIDV